MKKSVVLLFVALISFTGCKNLMPKIENNKTNNAVIISINAPETTTMRTASSILPETIYYSVSAKYWKDGKSQAEIELTKNPTREHNSKTLKNDATKESATTFEIENLDSNGCWTFYATGYTDQARTCKILESSGLASDYAIIQGGRYTVDINVYFVEEATGNINLSIDVSKSTINKLKITGTKVIDGEYQRNGDTILISKNDVKSGLYTALLSFYSDQVLMFTASESINVKDNLTTDTWIYSGGSVYLQSIENSAVSAATFVITPEIILNDKNNYSYVSNDGNDSNSGSYVAPHRTLQAAINRAIALEKEAAKLSKSTVTSEKLNSGETKDESLEITDKIYNFADYTIFIDETIAATEDEKKSATFSTSDNFNLFIKPKTENATINGSLQIDCENPIFINDCDFTGSLECLQKANLAITDSNISDNLTTGNGSSIELKNVTVDNITHNAEKLTLTGSTYAKTILLKNPGLQIFADNLATTKVTQIEYDGEYSSNGQCSTFETSSNVQDDSKLYRRGDKILVPANEDDKIDETVVSKFAIKSFYFVIGTDGTNGVLKNEFISLEGIPIYTVTPQPKPAPSENTNTITISTNGTLKTDLHIVVPMTLSKDGVVIAEYDENGNLNPETANANWKKEYFEDWCIKLYDSTSHEKELAESGCTNIWEKSDSEKGICFEYKDCPIGNYRMTIETKYLGNSYETEFTVCVKK